MNLTFDMCTKSITEHNTNSFDWKSIINTLIMFKFWLNLENDKNLA